MKMSPAHYVEQLESRRLLAGNVIVGLDANSYLHIVGDKKSNAFQVTFDASGGYRITGLDKTSINRAPAVVVNATDAVNFVIATGDGNDHVRFDGTDHAFGTLSVTIDTGNGNDAIELLGTTEFGDVNVSAGNGNDNVALSSTHVTKGVSVGLGKGNDSISLAASSAIDGDATIDTGDGNDRVSLLDSSQVGGLGILGGKGNESVVLSSAHVTGNLSFALGDGNDKVSFPLASTIDGNASIDGGKGNNTLLNGDLLQVGGSDTLTKLASKNADKKKHDDEND